MPFNHYAKMKQILKQQSDGWYIKRLNEPTSAKNFKGETINFSHYYRVYSYDDQPIKYCKFQQLDRFAQALDTKVESLIIVE